MSKNINMELVRVVERLRAAAKNDGAVYDLLATLSAAIVIDDLGNKEIHAEGEDLDYLRAVLLASDFAEYDRGE